MNQIFHNYKTWEDYKFGMYENIAFMDDEPLIRQCIDVLSCPEWLWECMTFVSHNWRFSAEQNLTNLSRNRQAWLGQASCCWINGAPEYITKLAWNRLTEKQQNKANQVADEVIKDWEEKYSKRYFEWQR